MLTPSERKKSREKIFNQVMIAAAAQDWQFGMMSEACDDSLEMERAEWIEEICSDAGNLQYYDDLEEEGEADEEYDIRQGMVELAAFIINALEHIDAR